MGRSFGRSGWVTLAGAAVVAGALCAAPPMRADVFAAREVPMEIATEGFSAAEILAQEAELHSRLTSLMPAGTLDQKISVPITEADSAELRAALEAKVDPLKVGVVKTLAQPATFAPAGSRLSKASSPFARGMLRATEGGGYTWATTVESAGATALRIHFDHVDLPAGAELFVMNEAGEAFGPYTFKGPNDSGEFWSNTVGGDKAIVMLQHAARERPKDPRQPLFSITQVGHLGPGFDLGPIANPQSFCGFNASCVQNASCTTGTPADSAKSAVALMQWIAGQFINTCTGGLIADSDNATQIPYFLTANHCLSSNSTAQNLQTYFQFTLPCGSSSCPAQASPGGIQRLGATVKATGTAGDFTLLQLNQAPPAGSVFLGWNSTAIANTNGALLYRISHPAWAPQSYSRHHVDTSAPQCTGWPRGQRIYSRDEFGATEGGSSGSPVVNAAGQIVGQLSGGCGTNVNNVCDAVSNATVDGAFAYYFPSVAPFLSGGGGSCSPNGTTCSVNADCCSNNCKNGKGGKTCK